MTFTLLQNFEVAVVLIVIKFLYFVDVVTGSVFEKLAKVSAKTLTIFISFAFIIGLGYAFHTQYLQKVLNGYLISTNYSAIHNTGNSLVLGAKSVRKQFPILVNELPFPEVTAKAILVADKKNKKLLYEKNSYERLASASTTKLMTALVALDIYSLDDVVTIPAACAAVDSTKAGLPEGTSYKVLDLLNTMLIGSAGDAACALSQGKVSQDEFIYRMNQKAHELGMATSFFTNPIGLDGVNSSHFSSAQDLYKLAVSAMDQNTIRQIVQKKEYTVSSVDKKFIGKIETTNKLLDEIPQTIGVKTGTTAEAGQVLIYEYKDDIKDLLIIVMGSEDRFTDVRALLQWLLVTYSWK